MEVAATWLATKVPVIFKHFFSMHWITPSNRSPIQVGVHAAVAKVNLR
jgi:hypothetical protein